MCAARWSQVHIVSSELQRSAAEELLAGFKRVALRSMVDVSTHVVVSQR